MIINQILFCQIIKNDTNDLTFTGTKIDPYNIDFDSSGSLVFSGYISTYYASYSDKANENGFEKFPTSSPRNNQFGLNVLQLSTKYQTKNLRGVATLFWGDIPQSSWSTDYNLIQEANLGFNIYKRLWIDAGFFRTHIGLESIQPRENMMMSFATTTFFEPYFLSGAKLTWEQSKKLIFQINVFNSFTTYVENNKHKTFGFSVNYITSNKFNLTYNFLCGDETNQTQLNVDKTRLYNNLLMIYKSKKLTLGFEGNYGLQNHSSRHNSTKYGSMFSSLLSAKYRFHNKYSVYGRVEQYKDLDEILTGKVLNSKNEDVGLELVGSTIGFEFKPIPNSYLRMESRILVSNKNEDIFINNNKNSNQRLEFIIGLGVWF